MAIKQSDVSYRNDNPAAYDCFRHPHVNGHYTCLVFVNKETGFPTTGDPMLDNKDSISVFTDVMNKHAKSFADETGMDIIYNNEMSRFELNGLDFKYSFEDQAEAQVHAEKVNRFDAECGAVLADFRQQMHEMYESNPESHLRDRNGFYSARGINDHSIFNDFIYKTDGSNAEKAAAMHSIADRFHEQHPDYRMGVYFTPCVAVSLFPVDWNGKPESLKDAERPTKKFLNSLTPEQMETHKQLLKDFDLASDDFIYAAVSGVDRGLERQTTDEQDFADAVASISESGQGMEQ